MMAIAIPRAETIAKKLGIRHPVNEGYDPLVDKMKLRMDHFSRDRFVMDYLDYPYTITQLADKLDYMAKALEKE